LEKNLVAAYVVKKFADGSVDVENANIEGTTELSKEQIFKDIEDTAELIYFKRIENAAKAGVFGFYQDMQQAQMQAAQAQAPAEGE